MQQQSPKVSVCITSYNHEEYIEECLQSVVDQAVDFPVEVLVSDDCSTDRTPKIIQSFADKYSFIRANLRQENVGAFENNIQTMNMAIGEYVCHLDGDDKWLPGKLQAQANFLDANPDFTVVWCKSNLFNDRGSFYSGGRSDDSLFKIFKNGIVTFSKALRFGSVAVHSSIMYRSSARETKIPSFEVIDLFYSWELLSKGNGKILDQILCEYRVSSRSSISTKSALKIRALNASHARYYFKKFPLQRNDVFLFGLLNMLVDIKNLRPTWKDFFLLVIISFSFKGLFEFPQHLSLARTLRVPDFFRR